MSRMKRSLVVSLIGSLVILMAPPAFARSISLKDAGAALWIFIIIGAVIVLLQLIPAVILFFSFIGTSTGLVAGRKKVAGEASEGEKVVLPGVEPVPVKE